MKAPILDKSDWNKIAVFVEGMRRPEHYRFLVLLMRKLGLRPLELAGLDRGWFRGGELRIPLGYSKRNEGRSLPVDQEIMDGLAAHMGDRTGRVFLNRDGDPFNAAQMSASVRRLMGMSGVEGSTYSARRELATRLVDEKVNILVVQRVLGHKHASTTMEYVGVTDTMLRNALFA